MSKYTRHSSVISRNTDEYVSEDHWLKQFEKSLQKGAVQPKSQQSLYDQINSIMNGTGSKYPSVQAAVDDMMQRSGLTNYLKVSNEQEVHTKTAAEISEEGVLDDSDLLPLKEALKAKNWYQAGKIAAELDRKDGQPRINGAESIRVMKYWKDPELANTQVPLDKWMEYTSGYGDGFGLTPEEKAKDLKFTQDVLNHIHGRAKKAADQNQDVDKSVSVNKNDNTPQVIKENPNILKTLENYVRTTRGNLPIPAIIDKIRSIHQGDVSEDKLWDDDNLIRLVSKLNLEAKKNNPASYENYNNLAVSDSSADSDIDPSNTDAFNVLMPAKL